MILKNYRPFKIVSIIGTLACIGSTLAILYTTTGKLNLCGMPECFSNFLMYYSFPMKLAAATIAILGIIGMLHRSEQMAKQIKITNEQNKYSNYFSHLKEFKEQIYNLELDIIQPRNINKLYKIIFPQNTHTNFDPVGTIDSLTAELQEMNAIVSSKVSEVSRAYCEEISQTYSPMKFAFAFSLPIFLPIKIADFAFCQLLSSESDMQKTLRTLGFNLKQTKSHISILAETIEELPKDSFIATYSRRKMNFLHSGGSVKSISISMTNKADYQCLANDLIKIHAVCQELSQTLSSDNEVYMSDSFDKLSELNQAVIETISNNYEEEIL